MKSGRREVENMELRKLLAGEQEGLAALAELERAAELGRRYLKTLRTEVVRLGGLAEPGLDSGVLKGIAERLGEEELRALKAAYEGRVEARYPVGVQLTYREEPGVSAERDGAFLI